METMTFKDLISFTNFSQNPGKGYTAVIVSDIGASVDAFASVELFASVKSFASVGKFASFGAFLNMKALLKRIELLVGFSGKMNFNRIIIITIKI
jgi:hypothetical protein